MARQTYADNVDANGKVFKTIGENIRKGARAGELLNYDEIIEKIEAIEPEISALQADVMTNKDNLNELEGVLNTKVSMQLSHEDVANLVAKKNIIYYVGTAKCKFYETLPSFAIAYYTCKNGYLVAGSKGVISLTDFDVQNGDDVTVFLEKIAKQVNYANISVQIPPGRYIVKRPIVFQRPIILTGNGVSLFAQNEYDTFSSTLVYDCAEEGYMFTLKQRSVVKGVCFETNKYSVRTNRTKYTGTISDVYTEHISVDNISCLACSSQLSLNNVSFVGFSGYAVYSSYCVLNNIGIWNCKKGAYVGTDSIVSNAIIRCSNVGIECRDGLLNCYAIRFEDIINNCVEGSSNSANIHGICDWCGGSILKGSFDNSNVSVIGRAACCIGEPNNALFYFTTQNFGIFTFVNIFNALDGDNNSKVTIPIVYCDKSLTNAKFVNTVQYNITDLADVIKTSDSGWVNGIKIIDTVNTYDGRGSFNSRTNSNWKSFYLNNCLNTEAGANGELLSKHGQYGKAGNKMMFKVNDAIITLQGS